MFGVYFAKPVYNCWHLSFVFSSFCFLPFDRFPFCSLLLTLIYNIYIYIYIYIYLIHALNETSSHINFWLKRTITHDPVIQVSGQFELIKLNATKSLQLSLLNTATFFNFFVLCRGYFFIQLSILLYVCLGNNSRLKCFLKVQNFTRKNIILFCLIPFFLEASILIGSFCHLLI